MMAVSHRAARRLYGTLILSTTAWSCSAPAASPVAARGPELWGDLKPVVSVKELMRDVLDPASDYVFDSVGITLTRGRTSEKTPKTDADWDRIRVGAVTMAEGAYLLKIPRPFAPNGDENNSTGPDASELSPAQIKAKLELDPVLWNAKIEALRNVGLEVMDIVRRRDAAELWDATENLDRACEACHIEYWYPGAKELMPKLDRRLRERDIRSRHE